MKYRIVLSYNKDLHLLLLMNQFICKGGDELIIIFNTLTYEQCEILLLTLKN